MASPWPGEYEISFQILPLLQAFHAPHPLLLEHFFGYTDYLAPNFELEKAMEPHSSTLAWKIPWAEEPGRLQSMGSQRVGHD